jgi:Amt family ammonium transporter
VTLWTGVFATRSVQAVFHDPQGRALAVGWIDGNPGQIGYQLVGIAMAWAFAAVGTIVLLKITDVVVGVRATEEQEIEGLDLTEHGEEAYNLEM